MHVRSSRRGFLKGLGGLAVAAAFPEPAWARTIGVSTSAQFAAALGTDAVDFTRIVLAPGIYDADDPVMVTKTLEIAGPPSAIIRAELAVFEATVGITGATLEQRPRPATNPNGDLWDYQPAQIVGHSASFYLTDFTASAQAGCTKHFAYLEGCNMFLRAKGGGISVNYGSVNADVIRAWYRSQFMSMCWGANTILIEGGATTGGIIHAAGSVAECRENTILRGRGIATAAAILGNLAAKLVMTGNGRIENVNIGMRAARGSEGWLDPAIALSGVLRPTLAQLGSEITR